MTTFDSVTVHDEEGAELPDPDVPEKLLRQTLTAIVGDKGTHGSRREFWADSSGEPP